MGVATVALAFIAIYTSFAFLAPKRPVFVALREIESWVRLLFVVVVAYLGFIQSWYFFRTLPDLLRQSWGTQTDDANVRTPRE